MLLKKTYKIVENTGKYFPAAVTIPDNEILRTDEIKLQDYRSK